VEPANLTPVMENTNGHVIETYAIIKLEIDAHAKCRIGLGQSTRNPPQPWPSGLLPPAPGNAIFQQKLIFN
jgi:hypothetical protein